MSGPSTHNYLTEGYISHTFGPQTTKDYVSNLFGVDAASIQAIRQCDVFYVLNPPSHYIPPFVSPASSVHGRGAWLLDVAVRFSGSVVPQRGWPSQGQGGHCRLVDQTQFRLPVFFTDTNGNFGIPVRDTSAGDMQLYGVNLPPQLLDKTIIKIRLSWPGYPTCEHVVPLRDQTSAGNPIPLDSFVRYVGNCLRQYLLDCEHIPIQGLTAHWALNWTVGYGNITSDDVKLIGLVHVSEGSWMPILQLARRVVL